MTEGWQFIPRQLMDEEERRDQARAWADGQRQQLSEQWAIRQRELTQQHVDALQAQPPSLQSWVERAKQTPFRVNPLGDVIGQVGEAAGAVGGELKNLAGQSLKNIGEAQQTISGYATEPLQTAGTVTSREQPLPSEPLNQDMTPQAVLQRQQAREAAGLPSMPAGEALLMAGPGELAAGARGLVTEVGALGREAPPMVSRGLEALNRAVLSPEVSTIARRLGGTIEDVSGAATKLPPEVEAALKQASTGVSGAKGFARNLKAELQGLFTPVPGQPTGPIINDLRGARGELDLTKDQAVRQSEPLINQWNRTNPEDRLGFMQRVQSGMEQPTPELQKLAEDYRARFDADYQLAQKLSPDLPYRVNYFTKSGLWQNPQAAEQFYNEWVKASLGGHPGSLEHAPIPTIYDGLKAGLDIKENNPEILYLNNHVALLRAHMAQDFMKAQEAKGADPTLVRAVVDRFMDPGLQGQVWYKTAREANLAMNSLQLGLSGFHATGTAINATVSKGALGLQQLLSGNVAGALGSAVRMPTASLEYAMRGGKIMKAAKAGEMTPDIANIIGGGGRLQMPEAYKGLGFGKAISDLRGGKVVKGAAEVPLALVNATAKPIMEWWVPRLKNGATADLIENKLKMLGPKASPDAIRAAKAEAVDSMDNRFGQLVYDNLFWNQTLTDLLKLGMRSAGWNIGTVRELGGGLIDIARLKPTDRAAYTITLPIVTGVLGAAYQYLKTGHGPQEVTDYYYPRTGGTDPKTRQPERVSFPTYMKDVFAVIRNPLQTVLNKQGPLVANLAEILQNKTYFGKPIRDLTADPLTQAGQLGAHEISTNLPFSLQTSSNRIDQGDLAKAESFVGITKAPGSVIQTGSVTTVPTKGKPAPRHSYLSTPTRKAASGGKPALHRYVSH